MKNKKYAIVYVCNDFGIDRVRDNYIDYVSCLFDTKEQAQKEIDKAIDDEIDTLNAPEKLEVIDPARYHYYPCGNQVHFGYFEEDGNEICEQIVSDYVILEFEV